MHTAALYVTQASARSPSGLISLPVSVMPSKNTDRLKNKLTAVNIPLNQRKLPWLTVTKEQIENAIFPKNMNRPEGLNKSEIIQLLIQVCCDRRTLFDADGKIKSTIELRKMLAYWQSFAYRASVDGPLWSTWNAPESWEKLTPPPSWHTHVAECERKSMFRRYTIDASETADRAKAEALRMSLARREADQSRSE